jgi:putative endonuclease
VTSAAQWSAYLLRCGDGSLYAGVATDVDRRFRDHGGPRGARYVKAHSGPSEVIWRSSPMTRSQALRTEIWIKGRSREQKFALAKGAITLPPLVS